MTQTRIGSLIESLVNIAVGFCLAMITNSIVMPAFGYHVTARDNFWITVSFTVVSLVRQYLLRRFFNARLSSTRRLTGNA